MLSPDMNSVKTFATSTPKKWCYDYIIVRYVHPAMSQSSIYNMSRYICLT